MQIASISGMAQLGSGSSITAAAPVSKAKVETTAQAAAPSSAASSAPSASSKSAPSSHGGGAGGDSAGTTSSSEQLVAEYSTTVDGKSYGGSVEKSGNEYTATASGVSGASASGSSITAAENSLGALISILA